MAGSYLVEMKTVPPGGRSMCVQPTETSVYLTEQPRRPSSGQPECAEEFKELVKQPDNYSLQSNYAGPPISLPWPAPSWDWLGWRWYGEPLWVIGIQPKSSEIDTGCSLDEVCNSDCSSVDKGSTGWHRPRLQGWKLLYKETFVLFSISSNSLSLTHSLWTVLFIPAFTNKPQQLTISVQSGFLSDSLSIYLCQGICLFCIVCLIIGEEISRNHSIHFVIHTFMNGMLLYHKSRVSGSNLTLVVTACVAFLCLCGFPTSR